MGLEPADLRGLQPDPDTWGAPYSFFSLHPNICSKHHFKNMRLVFDLTFCGDWGEPSFAGMCSEHSMGCQEFVAKHPEEMSEAYWSIRLLDVYTKQRHHFQQQQQQQQLEASTDTTTASLASCAQ